MTAAPKLPGDMAITRPLGDELRITRLFPEGHLSLYLGSPEVRMLGELLTAPNTSEIGAWLLEQAEELEQP